MSTLEVELQVGKKKLQLMDHFRHRTDEAETLRIKFYEMEHEKKR